MRKKEAKKCRKAFIYKEKRHFFIRENKEKRYAKTIENEKGKMGMAGKNELRKRGWTVSEMFSII